MSDFFDFFLYFIKVIVIFLFSIDLGIGFSFGEAMVGVTILSVLISALVIRYNRESISLPSDVKASRRASIRQSRNNSKKGS